MNELNGYYSCAVHPSQINVWYTALNRKKNYLDTLFNAEELAVGKSLIPKNLQDNRHNGKISAQAHRKIVRGIDYMLHVVPVKKYFSPKDGQLRSFRLNFITLTLSAKQVHPDNEIKTRILEPFLNSCRQRWNIVTYIWRAETQANGNLHFHIITDKFIPWSDLRNVWNRHQQNLGYIDKYREAQQSWHRDGFHFREDLAKHWSKEKQLKAWHEGIKYNWSNPNSTDVHSLHKIGNVKAYLTKYITKDEQSQNITGRLWGCSYNLSRLRGGESFAEGSAGEEIDKLIQSGNATNYRGDYHQVIYFTPGELTRAKYPILFDLLREFEQAQFPEYYPPGLFPN